MNSLHVVMYHYVRHIKSRFPSLKMRIFEDFCRQLDYLQNNFNIVTMENVIDAVHGETELQKNSCLLTFDDGYQEHFTEVFPELFRRGLSGAFYPPVCAISREHLLEVNKIQLILALNESRLNDILYEIKQIYVSEHKNRTPCFDKPYDAVWDKYPSLIGLIQKKLFSLNLYANLHFHNCGGRSSLISYIQNLSTLMKLLLQMNIICL